MSSIPLTSTPISATNNLNSSELGNPLPKLLQTPTGLAILEIQGTINMPEERVAHFDMGDEAGSHDISVGRLIFPDYSSNSEGNAWMKRVYLYIGRNQRLTGEVKKLAKPLAVVQKRHQNRSSVEDQIDEAGEEVEIIEIVRWKILFASRPEPVGS